MSRKVLLTGVLGLWLAVSGCEVEPYCLTCRDGDVPDAGSGLDAGTNMDAGDADLVDAGPLDAGRSDACLDEESCNDFDDDCDGFVDEGFDLQTNPENCGSCGNFCIFAHAFAMCDEGACRLGDCDVGFYDLNGEEPDGCEYNCPGTSTEDNVCNLRDDDCDGTVDEDVDKDNDPVNCGVCGRVCNFPHAAASCASGVCDLGDCEVNFYDIDAVVENGCEYACTPSDTGVEVCNARDDDCDGSVDEGNPEGGIACGGQTDSAISADANEGACQTGISRCEFVASPSDPGGPLVVPTGRLVCDGEVSPDVETCNEGSASLASAEDADDDCDGTIDEGNPDGGRVCGSSVGLCEIGFEVCTAGVLVCTGQVEPAPEICDGLDQDCDGVVDNGNPRRADAVGGGDSCDSDVGACSPGAYYCGPEILGACSVSSASCSSNADCGDTGGVCEGYVAPTGGTLTCVDPILVDPAYTGPSYRVAAVEVCNEGAPGLVEPDDADDDCDGVIDEGNPGGGAICGTDVGVCSTGTQACVSGTLVCSGNTSGGSEICNGQDDDCDGIVDEGNPRDAGGDGGGDGCGSAIGACSGGLSYCGPALPGTCSLSGASCTGAGDCAGGGGTCDGIVAATGGTIVCLDPIRVDPMWTGPPQRLPTEELCNEGDASLAEPDDADDDCDGSIDESVSMFGPEGGGVCGTSAGECSPGRQFCVSGALSCQGETTGSAEICDGLDNDCDGVVDNGDPLDAGGRGGGAACGSDVGYCQAGEERCQSGIVVCTGGRDGRVETCNASIGEDADDDCDGMTDEDFFTDRDVNNCGGCGIQCVSDAASCPGGVASASCLVVPNATPSCLASTCSVRPGGCDPGFVDLDMDGTNGCEYACTATGSLDPCNGSDDDCDGAVDEDAAPPTGICDPDGVCSGVEAICGVDPSDGATRVHCPYYLVTAYQEGETACDDADNDCDGSIDEDDALKGDDCFLDVDGNGQPDELGECRRTGSYVCDGADAEAPVVCDLPASVSAVQETCNGLDDDCDGEADEAGPPGVGAGLGIDASALETVTVTLSDGMTTIEMMAYEASRPDASMSSGGALDIGARLTLPDGSTRNPVACSTANVRPWTNVAWPDAMQACCNLNEDGQCPGVAEGGWRLCDAADWQTACEGPTGCGWSYQSNCGDSQPMTCNGAEVDSDSGLAGDQDAISTTGGFPMCHTDWGLAGDLFDMSGNVREWTAEVRSGDCDADPSSCLVEVRGGSFNHVEGGRRCDWDFTVAQGDTTAPNTGFRCCLYPDP